MPGGRPAFSLGQIARPAADRIGFQQRVLAVVVFFPDLHLRLFLEDAGEDREIFVHVRRLDFGERLLGKWGLRSAGRDNVVGVAARKGYCRSNNSHRREQGADKGPF